MEYTDERRERALKISELVGINVSTVERILLPKATIMYTDKVADYYSSYDGLMPIVAQENIKHQNAFSIYSTSVVVVADQHREQINLNCNCLIDALQKAIIFYLEH